MFMTENKQVFEGIIEKWDIENFGNKYYLRTNDNHIHDILAEYELEKVRITIEVLEGENGKE
jgi:hypothetical protein